MKTFKIYSILLFVTLLVGCGIGKEKQNAENLASNLFKKIQDGEPEKSMQFYSSTFYSHIPNKKWLGILQLVQTKLGKLKSYKLINYSIKKGMGTSGVKATIILCYQTTYERGTAIESLKIQNRNGTYLIDAHSINISLPSFNSLGVGSKNSSVNNSR
jgi:hypothetical protein